MASNPAGPGPQATPHDGVAPQAEQQAITTLAIRNLPFNLSQQDLLQAVDDSGFAGLYDFIYLPHKFKEHRNMGFAFINFVDADVASQFLAKWHQSRCFSTG